MEELCRIVEEAQQRATQPTVQPTAESLAWPAEDEDEVDSSYRPGSTSSQDDSTDDEQDTSASTSDWSQVTDYRQEVLAPRNIIIDQSKKHLSSRKHHFQLTTPSPLEKFDFPIFLHFSEQALDDIQSEFRELVVLHQNDAEFREMVRLTFLPFIPMHLESPERRGWQPVRMLELACEGIGAAYALEPPPLSDIDDDSDIADSVWDVRPACTYWITLEGFILGHRRLAARYCYCPHGWIFSPYLTVEFQQHDLTQEDAEARVAAAGALSLYNRYRLCRSVEDGCGDAGQSWAQVLHYGLTFASEWYDVWVLRPKFEPDSRQWHGCHMQRLDSGRCTSKSDLRRLVEWVNEIHYWAFTKFIQAVEQDVEKLLLAHGLSDSLSILQESA